MLLKNYKRNFIVILIGSVTIFAWLWTDGPGFYSKYQHGSTIEKALNYWYERGKSDVGLLEVLSIVDISNNKKLVFYETNNNTLMAGLAERRWNNTWVIIGQGGEVSLNDNIQQNINLESKQPVNFVWSNLNEFGITFGIFYDSDIKTITVRDKEATLLNKDSNRCIIWYLANNTDFNNPDLKTILDVKAYDKNRKLIYSYYPQ